MGAGPPMALWAAVAPIMGASPPMALWAGAVPIMGASPPMALWAGAAPMAGAPLMKAMPGAPGPPMALSVGAAGAPLMAGAVLPAACAPLMDPSTGTGLGGGSSACVGRVLEEG
jgi:hypothetical protein